MVYLDQFFELLVKQGASDLHIGEGVDEAYAHAEQKQQIRTHLKM